MLEASAGGDEVVRRDRVVRVGQVHLHDLGAGVRERRGRGLERPVHRGVVAPRLREAGHADAEGLAVRRGRVGGRERVALVVDAPGGAGQVVGVGARDDRVDEGRVVDAGRERADLVEAGGERDEPPGAYELTFCDNGVVSREKWRIAGAADDLSWGLFFYRGAAERAGQAYIGAVLASADGNWPPAEQMPDVEAALNACGIELWEMYEVCNKSCEAPPLEPIHALNKRYGERGRNLLEAASCLEAASA